MSHRVVNNYYIENTSAVMDRELVQDFEHILDLYSIFLKYEELKSARILKKKRKIREANKKRNILGYFKVTFLKIKEVNPQEFFQHTRMSKNVFNNLLLLCRPYMLKQSIRQPILPEQRLAITILYLSQGCTFQSLAWSWKMGKETVRQVVYETCDTLWRVLAPVCISEPTTAELSQISDDFLEFWNLPNCIGTIGGKHIIIKKPARSQAEIFKHNKMLSIVLLAACDAKYIFSYIDVGGYGSQNDGGVFQASAFGRKLLQYELVLPPPKLLPNSDITLPHFFVADAAFPLHTNIMKVYPGLNLSKPKFYYNSRISRVQSVIENAFGVLVSRWTILLTTLQASPENAEKIVLACIALHNFIGIHKETEKIYIPENYVDWEDSSGNLHEGLWRNEVHNNLSSISSSGSSHVFSRNNSIPNRDKLCAFINSTYAN